MLVFKNKNLFSIIVSNERQVYVDINNVIML